MSTSKELHVLFGRMNPPTIAHEMLLERMIDMSQGHFRVFLSNSWNLENPLTLEERISIINYILPQTVDRVEGARDLFTAMDQVDGYMQEHGYEEIVLWTGTDRVPAVERVKLYPERWKFKVVGISEYERDSDVSATAVRTAVVNKDTTTYNRMSMSNPYEHDWLFDTLYERLTDGSLQSKIKTGKGRVNRGRC